MGEKGEMLASRHFRDKNYRIITANYRSRFGEIDLIASDGQYIVFAEVKSRCEDAIASPAEFVTDRKIMRIRATAKQYMAQHDCALQPRFDVIEVEFYANGELKSLNHIENAFDCGETHTF